MPTRKPAGAYRSPRMSVGKVSGKVVGIGVEEPRTANRKTCHLDSEPMALQF